jgi:putative ATPase
MVISAEDIGLAYPQGVSIVKACVDSANMLGFPEARIPLAHATILLATAPKSNSAILAIDKAMSDLDSMDIDDIPLHLKDAHYAGAQTLGRGIEYKYPHNYENHYIDQQYLPDNIKDRVYYEEQGNKYEESIKKYWKAIKVKK